MRGEREPTKGPVLLVHGAGVRAELFRPPVDRTIVDTLNTFNDREELKDPLSKKYLVHSSYVNTPWAYACGLWAHDVI